MKVSLLGLSSVSATFELDTHSVYFAPDTYEVFLNEKLVKTIQENVFSLFGLTPHTSYTLRIGKDSFSFKTETTSALINVQEYLSGQPEDMTSSLQAAIMSLPPQGTLIFPAGDYYSGPLFLKSDMTLVFEKGAHLYGSPLVTSYPLIPGEIISFNGEKLQLMTWEGGPKVGMPSLLTGFYLNHVKIVGEGTIDGQAQKSPFWKDVKNLPYARPRLLYLNHCSNVSVMGLHLCNAPSWTVHPYFSSRLDFYDLSIENPKDAPNTDGINPECCQDVKIMGVKFSVGDDCIALKSGKRYIGETYRSPSEKITIRNCYMHEGHGAIVLGSEAGAGLRSISIERCYFDHTDRGLRIKSRRGRGHESVIDNIAFKDIIMQGVLTPLVINMFYFCDPDGHENWVQRKDKVPVDESTPYLGSFIFDNLQCTDAEVACGFFYGLPEAPIGSILIKDSSFTLKKEAVANVPAMMDDIEPMKKQGFIFHHVKSVTLDHVLMKGQEGKEVELDDVPSFKQV